MGNGRERAPERARESDGGGEGSVGAGKVTRTQGFPQSAAARFEGGLGGAGLRAEPWIMDDAASAALGLSASSTTLGGHARSSVWEPQLRVFLLMPGVEAEGRAAKLRLDLLLGTVRSMPAAERAALASRIEALGEGDELARLFVTQLPRASVDRVLAALRQPSASALDGAAQEAHASAVEDRDDAAGPDAMWRHVIGEASTSVGALARVRAPKGVRLRKRPAAAAADLGVLPFDELVTVERRTAHGWCWVVPMGQGSGAAGFCEEHFLSLDPPEPTAHLHQVAPGASLAQIAEAHYGKAFRDGRDARLYVQALVEANKHHRSVYLTEVSLDAGDTWHRGAAEERTLEVYRGAKVREGHVLWVPSETFIEQLRQRGAITSGTSAFSQAWRGAKAAVGGALDVATYTASFTVGLLEGAYNAVIELFQGAAEMVELVAKTVFQLLTGDLGAIKATLLGWVEKLAAAWHGRDKLADAFMKKWESDDAWTRGNFQGEVLGWVMMTALLILATAGQAGVAAATGTWAGVLRVIRSVDALGDITTYVGKAARLPGKAAAVVRRRVGKGTEDAAEALGEGFEEGLEDGLGAPDDLARAVARNEAGERPARGNKGHKPALETVTTSLDGHTFHNDIRKMSPSARHIIRQLEARGWVRVDEIHPADLVAISKWFEKEIAVVQSPYGRLRVVLGEKDRILRKSIAEGEVFIMHTHPMVATKTDHFTRDLERAREHVEAVIDWSGNITYYNKSGIKNSVRSDGIVEPLLGYKAAFFDDRGAIVGFAFVDIIDGANGAVVKVRP